MGEEDAVTKSYALVSSTKPQTLKEFSCLALKGDSLEAAAVEDPEAGQAIQDEGESMGEEDAITERSRAWR